MVPFRKILVSLDGSELAKSDGPPDEIAVVNRRVHNGLLRCSLALSS